MRQCGDCQLCCKLVPVGALGKDAGQRCKYQRHHKGCAVYAQLHRVSPECRLWSCQWLVNPDTADLSRPDRVHYVVDMMPDFVRVEDEGVITPIEVVQIWMDPDYPDAHRDPALRAWLERHNVPALCRYPDRTAVVVFPPGKMVQRVWHEKRLNLTSETPHTFEQVVEALAQCR